MAKPNAMTETNYDHATKGDRSDRTGRHSWCLGQMLILVFILVLAGFSPNKAFAHFLELIPQKTLIQTAEEANLSLDITFTHPFAGGPAMTMAAPSKFGVRVDGQNINLLTSLQGRMVDGKQAYRAEYQINRPGDHIFYMSPAPYWEAGEGKMIIHHTKVIVEAFGAMSGWDDLIGLPMEIKPLSRPYGLWSGNIFQGIVLKDGKPLPFAEVEIEYRGQGKVGAPAPAFETQVIHADAFGVFSYGLAAPGWWGFAALSEAKETMKSPTGKDVPVELGGLIWVKVDAMDLSGIQGRND